MAIKNKRGWLRIVEAVIAILIVAVALLFIRTENATQSTTADNVLEKERATLEMISKNEEFRGDILNGVVSTEMNNVINDIFPSDIWNYKLKICDLTISCPNDEVITNREVYSSEIMVVANDEVYSPKKLKIFVWEA
jgi:elongation factor P--beta-lysine ligase